MDIVKLSCHDHYYIKFFSILTVPPKIAPFYFNKDLSEGVRAQISCVIEKGDPPFTIKWYKDWQPLMNDDLKVYGYDSHSSTVVVDKVQAQHAGNYTCQAKNDVAVDEFTAVLVVSGKVPENGQNSMESTRTHAQ